MCNSSKVSRLGWWMHRIAGAQPLPCSLPGARVVSHSSAHAPRLHFLGTRVQPQRKINKLPFGKRQSLRSTSQESRSSQKTLCRLTSCPCVADGAKKKRREKFASSGVLPKPSPFPPEGEKTQDGEGSKENLGFRVFPRKKKKIGWADGRSDGAPTEAP